MTRHVQAQYGTSQKLQARIDTHRRYTVGPELEPAVGAALSLEGHEDVLDVGCGPGAFLGRLAVSGHHGRLMGLDFSAGMVAQAQAQFPGVHFQQGDAQHVPFPDGSFDLVTARHMLYHVADPAQAVREIHRVLKPGGRFLAVTNAEGYMHEWWDAFHAALGQRHERHPDSQRFTETDGLPVITAVFGTATVTFSDSALLFPKPESTLPYFRSLFDVPPSPQDEADFLREVQRLQEPDGWHVSKRVVLIAAHRRL